MGSEQDILPSANCKTLFGGPPKGKSPFGGSPKGKSPFGEPPKGKSPFAGHDPFVDANGQLPFGGRRKGKSPVGRPRRAHTALAGRQRVNPPLAAWPAATARSLFGDPSPENSKKTNNETCLHAPNGATVFGQETMKISTNSTRREIRGRWG